MLNLFTITGTPNCFYHFHFESVFTAQTEKSIKPCVSVSTKFIEYIIPYCILWENYKTLFGDSMADKVSTLRITVQNSLIAGKS